MDNEPQKTIETTKLYGIEMPTNQALMLKQSIRKDLWEDMSTFIKKEFKDMSTNFDEKANVKEIILELRKNQEELAGKLSSVNQEKQQIEEGAEMKNIDVEKMKIDLESKFEKQKTDLQLSMKKSNALNEVLFYSIQKGLDKKYKDIYLDAIGKNVSVEFDSENNILFRDNKDDALIRKEDKLADPEQMAEIMSGKFKEMFIKPVAGSGLSNSNAVKQVGQTASNVEMSASDLISMGVKEMYAKQTVVN